jgi:aldehyde oxidoreductase
MTSPLWQAPAACSDDRRWVTLEHLTFSVNGEPIEVEIEPLETLLHVLRERLRLTGVKNGCGEGECGACTVLLDGVPVHSCILPAMKAKGRAVTTIEGLERADRLHPLQETFIRHGAIQCGFCTPGMIMAAKGLLDENPDPDEDFIKKYLKGNLCRCTGYYPIITAIQEAARILRLDEGTPLELSLGLPKAEDLLGKPSLDKEVVEKATGRLVFSDDLRREEMLHGKLLLSPLPHAEILGIDTSLARQVKGVHKILTSQDVPGPNRYGGNRPVLADKKVRFIGDVIAAVFAETPEAAEEAVRKIKVNFNALPVVSTPEEALRPDAPKIHEEGNICGRTELQLGDVDEGFKEADAIVGDEYTTPFLEHGYLEPEAGLGMVEPDGKVVVWIGTQAPFTVREEIASNLCLPKERVRVVGMPMGGAFGSKFDLTIEIILALGASLTRKSVKIALTRTESLRMSTKRHPYAMKYRIGATKDGRFTALEASMISDAGAYTGCSASVMEKSVMFGGGPYFWPAYHLEGLAVYTNNVLGGAFRGYGVNQVHFALESLIDALARELKMDPFEIRLINALEEGKRTIAGEVVEGSVAIKETLIEAKKWIDRMPLPKSEPGKRMGMGVASGWKNIGVTGLTDDRGGAIFTLMENGRIQVTVSAVDMGQGTRTVMAQIASEVTGVDYDRIDIVTGDTLHMMEWCQGTSQRQTIVVGNAVMKGGERFREKMFSLASEFFDVPEAFLVLKGGFFIKKENGEKIGSLRELHRWAESRGIEVEESYDYHSPKSFRLKESPVYRTQDSKEIERIGRENRYRNYISYSYGTQVAFVEFDETDGSLRVVKMVLSHDAGKALNPKVIRGQLEGSAVMGVGYVFTEEFVMTGGTIVTDSLGKCGIPRIQSIPDQIECVLVEKPDPNGPFGAKGISEAALVQTAPAITNAIYDACGVRIRSLPIKEPVKPIGSRQPWG